MVRYLYHIWRCVMFEPKFVYTNDIVKGLLDIEKYKTQLEYLSLPTNITQEMVFKAKMKKTHFSTRIEGNLLSYAQVERAITEKDKKTTIDAEREVVNYWDALSYLEKCKEENRQIDNQLILELHGIIERRDVRKKIIGFRQKTPPGVLFAVYDSVNMTPEYIPPEAKDIEELMNDLTMWYNTENNLPVPIKAAIVSYQLVTIHPFEDGNGRTCRALATYVLMLGGYDFKGFNSMEEYYANNLEGYYKNLQMGLPVLYYDGRNNPPHLENWIEYFIRIMSLNAENISWQARDATKDERERLEFESLNKKDMKMLRYLLENNMDTIKTKDLANIFNVTPRAITKWCSEWVDRGVLKANYKNVRITSYSLNEKYKKLV